MAKSYLYQFRFGRKTSVSMTENEGIKRRKYRRYIEIWDEKFTFCVFEINGKKKTLSEQELFPVVGRIVLGNSR